MDYPVFNQDNINRLTNYILENKELALLANQENWQELFNCLYKKDSYKTKAALRTYANFEMYGYFAFLYNYFNLLGENVFQWIDELSLASFYHDSGFNSISIPGNVEIIGQYSFWYSHIENVKLEPGVKIISGEAFYNCKNLKSIEIPDTVIEIGRHAFSDLRSLESIKLPKLKYLGDKFFRENISIFFDCYDLKNIYFPGTVQEWEDIGGRHAVKFSSFGVAALLPNYECTVHCSNGDQPVYFDIV